jgi:hypothetical protein
MIMVNSSPYGIPARWYSLPLINKQWRILVKDLCHISFRDGSQCRFIHAEDGAAAALCCSGLSDTLGSLKRDSRQRWHQFIEFIIHNSSLICWHPGSVKVYLFMV